MAPRKGSKAKPAARPSAKSPSKTAVKPLATGDVEQFPSHVYRADLGEGLPPQAPPPTATDKAK